MQALLTLPKQLQDLPTRFNKINKTVYFEQKTQQFYKITALQPVTVFIGQDVVTRQNLVMTKYDPSFLVLHFISQNQSFSVNELPKYLSESLFRKFTTDNGSTLKADKQKILEFIQQRIDKLTQLIEQKQYAKTAKKLNFVNKNKDMGKKQISFEVVDILRNDIPALYLQQLLTTRYHEQKFVKPVVVDEFVEEDDDKEDVRDKIKNKKKTTSKPKIAQPLPKNQTTLFQFSSKKQAKGSQ